MSRNAQISMKSMGLKSVPLKSISNQYSKINLQWQATFPKAKYNRVEPEPYAKSLMPMTVK